ncbi:MAG: flavodoxin family protein, partial [Phycisphaerae bacterium]|nr:flavodoxin family protein [Phycisphaerae bacterium]
MVHILGIVGSPRRKGNTDVLVSHVLAGAEGRGATTETLFLNDLTIRECDGCHACWQGKRCPKADDMAGLYARIEAADGIVFGTPVYWYGPTGILKLLIDRFVYFNCPENRPQIAGTRVAIAVPYEDTDAETVRPLLEFFKKSFAYLEMNCIGQIVVPGVTIRGEVAQKPDCLQAAFELGV